ncbi:hypothetical protein JR316_0003736 [Psilocybe cubensis]|uniref:Protein kinase domain-containing protein n=2 Tax=Psilocybe cubensis TaxID=181762 RepID=A0A8H7Y3A3_PSICU|nr:hypothetical protein JR316_0003736 [Psilocybe cubensis]KAH9484256.1 hypothetical protein JR316_0003736 [Psilocybe cubensis]
MRRSLSRPVARTHSYTHQGDFDNGEDPPPSPSSSDSSVDEEEVNRRVKPFWPKYQAVFRSRGIRLDTVRDVKLFYKQQLKAGSSTLYHPFHSQTEFQQSDDALCPDAGLPDNLFRGIRISDSKRVVVKAVHAGSREYSIVYKLSQPPFRNDPMNHTIPVLDQFTVPEDDMAFIIMEEWSTNLVASLGPCCMTRFLLAMRQCIEHAAFLHKHRIAHLDISLMNLLTDYHGRYAYIDYELSRHFDNLSPSLIYNYRGTELPPESESSTGIDPYKVDVWALGVLILRACKLTGYWIPELMLVIKPMLEDEPSRRPSSWHALHAFDKVVTSLGYRLESNCNEPH